MKVYRPELNISDIGILTDIIIQSSNNCTSAVTAVWALELIDKLQEPLKTQG